MKGVKAQKKALTSSEEVYRRIVLVMLEVIIYIIFPTFATTLRICAAFWQLLEMQLHLFKHALGGGAVYYNLNVQQLADPPSIYQCQSHKTGVRKLQ